MDKIMYKNCAKHVTYIANTRFQQKTQHYTHYTQTLEKS